MEVVQACRELDNEAGRWCRAFVCRSIFFLRWAKCEVMQLMIGHVFYGGILEDERGQRLLRAMVHFGNVAFRELWARYGSVQCDMYIASLGDVVRWSEVLVAADVAKTCAAYPDLHSLYRQKFGEYYMQMHPERRHSVHIVPAPLEGFLHAFAVVLSRTEALRSGDFFALSHAVPVRLICADALRDTMHEAVARTHAAGVSPHDAGGAEPDGASDDDGIAPTDSASNVGAHTLAIDV